MREFQSTNKNDFTEESSQLAQIFSKMVQKFFFKIVEYPLHEIFYIENVEILKENLNQNVLENVSKPLSQPYLYIDCDQCKKFGYSTEEDVFVAYKIFENFNKSINNAFEWYFIFILFYFCYFFLSFFIIFYNLLFCYLISIFQYFFFFHFFFIFYNFL